MKVSKKKLLMMLGVITMVAVFAFIQGCSNEESPIQYLAESQVDGEQLSTESGVEIIPQAMIDQGEGDLPVITGNCSWWNSLGQSGRNRQIILEALYSVDRQIWDQNRRCTCDWNSYLRGQWGCYIPGDWPYSNRSHIPGYSGQCKDFARELLERASGGAASLPGGTYDYRSWYPWRNRQDGINHAQPGELMQLTGSRLHTAIIITNFHDGRFEVVDGNYCVSNRIAKHVINVNTGAEANADLKFYVIDCY